MFRLTPVVRNLVIINVIVYILQLFVEGVTGKLELWGPNAVHVFADAEPFRPYQLFTYMFAHDPKSFFHVSLNMLVLATTGPILENFWGQKKFLIFYLVTGIGAGIFHLGVETFVLHSPGNPMLGASGAIYGVLMAFGMMFPNMEVTLLFPPIPLKAKYLVWVLGVMTYLTSGAHVAHFAHLGGIVFAFILLRIWRSQDGSYF